MFNDAKILISKNGCIYRLMSGAGRTFGLDYWVMPWISDQLSKWRFGKRIPVYNQELQVKEFISHDGSINS